MARNRSPELALTRATFHTGIEKTARGPRASLCTHGLHEALLQEVGYCLAVEAPWGSDDVPEFDASPHSYIPQ